MATPAIAGSSLLIRTNQSSTASQEVNGRLNQTKKSWISSVPGVTA